MQLRNPNSTLDQQHSQPRFKVKKENMSKLVQQAMKLIKEEMRAMHGESKKLIKFGQEVERHT